MQPHYQRRLIYVSTIGLLIMYASAIILLILSFSGCAIRDGYKAGVRKGYNIGVYEPFNNFRDGGLNYLVGPPSDQVGPCARVDDGGLTHIDKLAPQLPLTRSIPKRPLPSLPERA